MASKRRNNTRVSVSGGRYIKIIRLSGSKSHRSAKREALGSKRVDVYWRKYMPQIGTRKLYKLIKPQLIEHDIKLGRDGFFTYLRNEGLLNHKKKRFVKTTLSKPWLKKHPNLLKNKAPDSPRHVLVSDITYVESGQGVHYLSLVTDSNSRKIVGYHLS